MADGGALSPRGWPTTTVIEELDRLARHDVDFHAGRSFGLTYKGSDALDDLLREVAAKFALENGFGLSAMPSLVAMENDIIAIATGLFHAPAGARGTVTSGGTESIFLAVQAAARRAGIRDASSRGSIVGPRTAHPAFRKACDLMGITWISVEPGPDFHVDPAAFVAALRDDTMLAVGSAPSYPWGMVDDIAVLSRAAGARGIPFHVDAAIGGFLLPFLDQLGADVPAWDMRLPDVTSISADLHKYGLSARGASLIIQRDPATHAHQSYSEPDWPGGAYMTRTMLGSRSAAPIATAWAALHHLGREGYMAMTRAALAAKADLIAAIEDIDGFHIVGTPIATILAIGSDKHDIIAIGHELTARGWYVGQQQHPRSLHFIITAGNLPVMEEFTRDLAVAAASTAPAALVAINGYGHSAAMPQRMGG